MRKVDLRQIIDLSNYSNKYVRLSKDCDRKIFVNVDNICLHLPRYKKISFEPKKVYVNKYYMMLVKDGKFIENKFGLNIYNTHGYIIKLNSTLKLNGNKGIIYMIDPNDEDKFYMVFAYDHASEINKDLINDILEKYTELEDQFKVDFLVRLQTRIGDQVKMSKFVKDYNPHKKEVDMEKEELVELEDIEQTQSEEEVDLVL